MRKFLFLMVLLLPACATPVFEAPPGATALTPAAAISQLPRAEGQRVIWGGQLVSSRNLESATELVVLGYPLSREQRPRTRAAPVGRFIVRYPGYLETVEFAPGRLVTVDARLAGLETRAVGEADYRYPLVRADAVHLWPEGGREEPRVHFGVGIGIHN